MTGAEHQQSCHLQLCAKIQMILERISNFSDRQRRMAALVTNADIVVETLGLPQNTGITRLDQPLTPSKYIEKGKSLLHVLF